MPRTKSQPLQTFAQRLTAAREALGLSAQEVAAAVGCTRMAVYYWEDGHAVPRPKTQAPLAALLKVSAGWLMFGEGTGPQFSQPR